MCYAGWHQGGALQRHLEAHRGGGRCPLHGGTGSNSDILHGWDSVGRAVQAAVKGNESVAEPGEQLGYWVLGETDGDIVTLFMILKMILLGWRGGECFPSTKSLLKINNDYQYVQNCDIWL